MTGRQQRGIEIARKHSLKATGDFWIVPSQSNESQYVVQVSNDSPKCTCPDHTTRQTACKHIIAVQYTMLREIDENGTETVTETVTLSSTKKTYKQDWPKYNAAQVNEKRYFQILLKELCAGLAEQDQSPRRGRPRLPISDRLFSAIFKVYSTVSGRRFMTDLNDAAERGYIAKAPHYNSVFNVFDDENTASIMNDLVVRTSLPLRSIEKNFAVDSTGFSASRFDRWFSHKHGKEQISRTWVKLHAMVGIKTNVVTSIEIKERNSNDSPMLKPLLETTSKNFDIKEVTGDSAYSSISNAEKVAEVGAVPYLDFRATITGRDTSSETWNKMFHLFNFHQEKFYAHYGMRANVESTFHMIKAKFGDSVRSKTDLAMKNEVRAKVVCHNICCLISAIFELGISPKF